MHAPTCDPGNCAVMHAQEVTGDPDARNSDCTRWVHPTHVVVDLVDGHVFSKNGTGLFRDQEDAEAFAAIRNLGLKPEHQTYMVFALTAVGA